MYICVCVCVGASTPGCVLTRPVNKCININVLTPTHSAGCRMAENELQLVYIYIYIYVCMCVCICVCMCVRVNPIMYIYIDQPIGEYYL